tara:strand:- start:19 stop:246 length:228 start_codon:yes stop_codon:yes gene_type:complete
MKKRIIDCQTGEDTIVDFSTAEVTEAETNLAGVISQREQARTDKEAKETLKASAKTKLIAGEALTEEEADVMIGG